MARRRQLFEGRVKDLFEGLEPSTIIIHSKDDTCSESRGLES